MKESSSFTKLTLLNRWKRIVLILDSQTKMTFIRGIGGKEQLILHWKVKYNTYFETNFFLDATLILGWREYIPAKF